MQGRCTCLLQQQGVTWMCNDTIFDRICCCVTPSWLGKDMVVASMAVVSMAIVGGL